MPETLKIYEQAPTTTRSARELVVRHGFESLSAFAELLPPDAMVLDAGSGASPLGTKTAALRPDITWVNFDYSYGDPKILQDISKNAPPNVKYIAGDVTQLTDMYKPETFDVSLSYWLAPHLSLDEDGPALKGFHEMFTVTKTNGLLSIGPKRNKAYAVQIRKQEGMDADRFAANMLATTKLSLIGRRTQKAANRTAAKVFGTSRILKREGDSKKIYYPKSDEYVPTVSVKGLAMIGRMTVGSTARSVMPDLGKKHRLGDR